MCRMCAVEGDADAATHHELLERRGYLMAHGGKPSSVTHLCKDSESRTLMKARDGAYHEYFCPVCWYYYRLLVADPLPVRGIRDTEASLS